MWLMREERSQELRVQELEKLGGIGRTTEWIPILVGTPVAPRRRILSQIQEQQAIAQAREWHDKGVVERISPPPLVNNLVLVAKKDGRTRVCVDCTPANRITEEFGWPLPRLQDLRYRIKGATWFSRLDLQDAFFRIRIPTQFRHLTAFRAGNLTYQFTRMPFGLKTAPATFQRFMDWGLSEYENESFWFIDDILIHANSRGELDRRTARVEKRLSKMKCVINEDKSERGKRSLLYAGLWIMGHGIGPNLEQARKILGTPPPRTKADALSALGLVSYLRDFISLASHFTARLYPTKQGFSLSAEQYASEWSKLLRHLVSALTINHHFQDGVDADVYADASQYALGIVVLQQERIVAVASRKLTPAETRYSATDREHLGLVYAVDKFKIMLHRKDATTRVWSDHAALIGRKQGEMTPRQARWHDKVTSWIPNLTHVPGKCNPADFISRWRVGTVGANLTT